MREIASRNLSVKFKIKRIRSWTLETSSVIKYRFDLYINDEKINAMTRTAKNINDLQENLREELIDHFLHPTFSLR